MGAALGVDAEEALAVELQPRASAWAALSRVPAPRRRDLIRLLDDEQLHAAHAMELRSALGADGGAALLAYAAERVAPIGGGRDARARLAGAVIATAACFEFGDHVLGIAPRTSVAGVLLGPHDELAALLHRVHDSVARGVAASGAGKLVRMLTLEAGRLRAAAVREIAEHAAPPAARTGAPTLDAATHTAPRWRSSRGAAARSSTRRGAARRRLQDACPRPEAGEAAAARASISGDASADISTLASTPAR